MNGSLPKGLLFDAGNTLVFLDRTRVSDSLERVGFSVDPHRLKVAEFEARRALVAAVVPGHVGTEGHLWRRYFRTLLRKAGVPLRLLPRAIWELRASHRDLHLWTGPGEGVDRALSDLSAAGFRLGVISNADGRMEEAIRVASLRSHFEFVIDSGDVGVEKPDPRIFHQGCDSMGLHPSDCVYVGDLYQVDVVGAVGAGLYGVLLDPFGLPDASEPKVGAISDLHDHLATSWVSTRNGVVFDSGATEQ